jgi:hypothetical protein
VPKSLIVWNASLLTIPSSFGSLPLFSTILNAPKALKYDAPIFQAQLNFAPSQIVPAKAHIHKLIKSLICRSVASRW